MVSKELINVNFIEMKKEILEVLHKNVEVSLAIEQNVILEWDFEKVAEELNALFAKRIVSHCACTPDETTGTTTVRCCNVCGKPAESFWHCG